MESRYEIRGEVGQGGVGVVYEAWDRQLARFVALKRLLPLDPESAAERERNLTAVNDLLREASILSSMQHPNIVSVFDAGVDEMGSYVVMELVDGEVLREAIERGPLLFEDFIQVVEQCLDALISAHHHGLLHRDIKPRNIMFRWLPSEAFQVKILDFGLAKFSPRPSKQTEAYKDTIMGSSAYMAPEQFEHEPLDFRTDIYSMGCVFYYCLAGKLPFDGDTAAEVMESHLQHRVTPLRDRRQDIPAEICEWVMWLIRRQPDDRPATAKQALTRFRELLQDSQAETAETAEVLVPEPLVKEPEQPIEEKEEPAAPAKRALPNETIGQGASRNKMIGLAAAILIIGSLAFLLIPRGNKAPIDSTTSQTQGPPDPFQTQPGEPPLLLVEETNKIAENLGKEVRVRGLVTNTGKSNGGTNFLNFEPPEFCVVSFPSDRHLFRLDPADLYDQKQVEVTGTVEKYQEQFQIKLSSPDQIRVLE